MVNWEADIAKEDSANPDVADIADAPLLGDRIKGWNDFAGMHAVCSM